MTLRRGRYAIFLALLGIAFSFSLPSSLNAQAYYGQFLDELEVRWNMSADRDWNTVTLLDDFRFDDPNGLLWTTPKNYTVNGASIPRWAWVAVGSPYTGRYLPASVIHDYYVEVKERTAHDTHRNFYYGMLANGVPWAKARTMYWAVSVYSDWEITAPGSARILKPANLEDERELVGVVQAMERKFQDEANGLRMGEFGEPIYDLADIERDATEFRKALVGEIGSNDYQSIISGSDFDEFIRDINRGSLEFEYIAPRYGGEPAAFPVSPLEETRILQPLGIPYSVTISGNWDLDYLTELANIVESGQLIYVDESSRELSAVDQYPNIVVGLERLADGMKETPFSYDASVQIVRERPDSNVDLLATDEIKNLSEAMPNTVFVYGDQLIDAVPQAPLAENTNGGVFLDGDYTNDGEIRFQSQMGVNMFSGFGGAGPR
ncbi:MAG: DUF1353 domain-containing protein [Oricola sp.]|nr:MAG: DUF1353 domain-containing protein [Oricola sp.]